MKSNFSAFFGLSKWDEKKTKYIFKIIGSGTTPNSTKKKFYDGNIPWVTTSELRENNIKSTKVKLTQQALEEFTSLKIYPADSLLVAMYGATIGRIAILGIPATVNQAVCVLSSPSNYETLFAFYAFQVSRKSLQSLASGGGQPNLNAEIIRNYKLPCPTKRIQIQVVKYLSKTIKKINSLIQAKENLISIIWEKRQALIYHTVTKGGHTKSKFIDSNENWLGQLPKHWYSIKIKFLIHNVVSGVSVNAIDSPAEAGSIGVLKTSAVSNGIFFPNENKTVVDTEIDRVLCPVKKDTIIMSRMNTPDLVGACGFVYKDYPDLFLPDRLWAIDCEKEKIGPQYLNYLFTSKWGASVIQSYASGTSGSMKNISKNDVFNIKIPVPPINEQKEIVAYIKKSTEKIDKLKTAAEKSIHLLKERRTALIAAAVTGQLDIQEEP